MPQIDIAPVSARVDRIVLTEYPMRRRNLYRATIADAVFSMHGNVRRG
jgi:hypothetical protein